MLHRCLGATFDFLISRPTISSPASFRYEMDNVGDQPVMMSDHFQQTKPSTTAFNVSVTVASDNVRTDRQVPDASPRMRGLALIQTAES